MGPSHLCAAGLLVGMVVPARGRSRITMTKALITDLEGTVASDEELAFLAEADPWGLILFARNVESPAQVRALTASFRDAVGRSDAPVFVDQEGGRVQRLKPPHWRRYPSGAQVLAVYRRDQAAGLETARALGRLHARDLLDVGITVDCLPVIDVAAEGMHDVIGDRALGRSADEVSDLGQAICEGLLDGGVLPVIKHIPGHGRARADSHHELPVVEASLDEMDATDFEPFRRLSTQAIAMTAHVVFSAIDPHDAATLSQAVVEEVIRDRIGFDGLLVTDDICMNALSGDVADRARRSLAAGCDIVLHCNRPLAERRALADAVPPLRGDALRRAEGALSSVGRPAPADFDRLERAMDEAMTDLVAAADPTRYEARL